MNERIRELWTKAAESTAAYPSGQNNSWETQVNFLDKFAELIVRECMNICADCEEDIRTRIKDEGKAATAYMCRAHIKEHFGVE
jgi:hypothetical protein